MKSQTTDRRVRKTQALLKQSLIELMHVKDFKDITIKDITELADLNRSTFYLHYEDIYDLLNQIEDEAIQNLGIMLFEFNTNLDQTPVKLLEQVFVYITENKALFKILLQHQNAPRFVTKIQKLVHTIGLETVQSLYSDQEPIHYTFFLSFISNGILGVTITWLNDGLTLTPQEMAQLVDAMISNSNLILNTTAQ